MPSGRERLQFAFNLLAKSDEGERLAGATELLELAHDSSLAREVRPKLLDLLVDAHPQLRAAAVRALPAVGPSTDLIPLLERAAHDDDVAVRREASRSLGGLEERAALPALVACLGDADPQVRFEAAVGLASLNDRSGATVLLEGLNDKVRLFFALGALARLGEERAREGAERILHKRFFISDFERTQAAGLLTKLGSAEGREYLLARVRNRRGDDRGLAMELCGEHRVTEAVPALREAMAAPKELFRGTAARSLGLLRNAHSTPLIASMASNSSEDYEVRCDAIEGLMFMRSTESLAAIHAVSSGAESEEMRAAASDALAWLQRHPEEA